LLLYQCTPQGFNWDDCDKAIAECFRCYGCCDTYQSSMAVAGGIGGTIFNCTAASYLGAGSSCSYVGAFGSCECATESHAVCVSACASTSYGSQACGLCYNMLQRWPDLVDFF
jgi:hypothetical protein